MLPLQVIREQADQIAEAMEKRGLDARPTLAKILNMDQDRRNLQTRLDQTLAESHTRDKSFQHLRGL